MRHRHGLLLAAGERRGIGDRRPVAAAPSRGLPRQSRARDDERDVAGSAAPLPPRDGLPARRAHRAAVAIARRTPLKRRQGDERHAEGQHEERMVVLSIHRRGGRRAGAGDVASMVRLELRLIEADALADRAVFQCACARREFDAGDWIDEHHRSRRDARPRWTPGPDEVAGALALIIALDPRRFGWAASRGGRSNADRFRA